MQTRPREPAKKFIDSFCNNPWTLLTINPTYMNAEAMKNGMKHFGTRTIRKLFLYYVTHEDFLKIVPEGDCERLKFLDIETIAVEGLQNDTIIALFTNLPAGVHTIAIENLEVEAIKFIRAFLKEARKDGRTFKIVCGPTIPPRFIPIFNELSASDKESAAKKRKTVVISDEEDSDSEQKKKKVDSSSKKIIAALEEELSATNTKLRRLEKQQTEKNKLLASYQASITELQTRLTTTEKNFTDFKKQTELTASLSNAHFKAEALPSALPLAVKPETYLFQVSDHFSDGWSSQPLFDFSTSLQLSKDFPETTPLPIADAYANLGLLSQPPVPQSELQGLTDQHAFFHKYRMGS